MPGGDRTGPDGRGPRTGRDRGYCAGFGRPGSVSPGFRRGFGRRMREISEPKRREALEEELQGIEQEQSALEEEKERIRKQLEDDRA